MEYYPSFYHLSSTHYSYLYPSIHYINKIYEALLFYIIIILVIIIYSKNYYYYY